MTDAPENNPISNDQIDPDHSKPLDVHRWSDHPEINKLVDELWFQVVEPALGGKSNNKGKSDPKRQLKVLLLDLYVAWLDDPTLCIGINRNNNAYAVNSRYNALHISRKIGDVSKLLIQAGYLDYTRWSNPRQNQNLPSRTSRIRPSLQLQDKFSDLVLSPSDIEHNYLQETVILTDYETDEEGNYTKSNGKKKRQYVEYDDTDFTKDIRRELGAYNQLLQETYIDIGTLEEPFVVRTKKDGTTQRIKIDQSKKFVRRIFSRGDWKYNGRFYGGFWQQVGSEYRKDIYVNDSPTVEVDYKGLHAAILSAEKGIVYGGDRYELGSVVCPRLDKQQQRKAVKLLVLAAINAKDRSSAFGAFRQAQPTGSVEKTLDNDELILLLDTFLHQHPYLEDGICSDQGIRLMNVDSHITNFIIKEFVRRQKPILSVHDSYIVDTMDVELLRECMKEASLHVVGADLAVEQEAPSYQEVMATRHQDYDAYLHLFKSVLVEKGQQKTEGYYQRYQQYQTYREGSE
jgi:hypothetical protein